jgi:hypothetical protein
VVNRSPERQRQIDTGGIVRGQVMAGRERLKTEQIVHFRSGRDFEANPKLTRISHR